MSVSVVKPKKAVLVLDDSELVLLAARQALTDAGFEVFAVDNPLVVPGVVRRHHVDLALIDVNMPSVRGDVVTRILAHAGVSPGRMVLFSSIAEPELQALAASCGVLGYICKKDDEHLVAEVTRLLRSAG